jgi:hypothetical protein
MKFTCRNVNLTTLPATSKLWGKLKELTVPGWRAYGEFDALQNGCYKNEPHDIRLVYHKGEIVAWGMMITYKHDHPNLWLYTRPDFRNKGVQKKYVLSYFKKLGHKYAVWAENEIQKKVFSALPMKIDVSGYFPVDLSVEECKV